MGKSIRSKRQLMLRAAKASALDTVLHDTIEQKYQKLQHQLDVQNGDIERTRPPTTHSIELPTGDVPVIKSNVIDFRADVTLSSISYRSVDNDTREDNIGVKKEGSRLPIQVHSHPHIDEVIQSTTITPYKASQFSYLRTPAESIYHAKAHKSSTDYQSIPARIQHEKGDKEPLNQVIAEREAEEKALDNDPAYIANKYHNKLRLPRENQSYNTKTYKAQKRKYDILISSNADTDMIDASTVNNTLASLTGNQPRQSLSSSSTSKRQRIDGSSDDRHINEYTRVHRNRKKLLRKKKSPFDKVSKYSGRGRM